MAPGELEDAILFYITYRLSYDFSKSQKAGFILYIERFQNSLWETHTKISNKQLQKATMLF